MPDIYAALNRLKSPTHYRLDQEGELFTFTLSDSKLGIQSVRLISVHEYLNPGEFRVSVLHAVEELRGKGSLVELSNQPYVL
ncbi:hypothetical protein SFA35_25530 (plasmid) [Pseudomonas sp. HR96]|uniref:hypothetical protein n=1 Tax=Pseudomonas sp. HR96 TaxID=1027966 RepID=UPI002A76079A|nr:hypothetical protein [Pseudomonas sp. HR96]WPP02357.1 hypothetical protein SFA35_25530 [Pseudomonas sp. HR96]